MPRNSFLLISFVIALLLIPQSLGGLYLNFANAEIAHALWLPQDAPDRATALGNAQSSLERGEPFAKLMRAPLASARIALAREDPKGANARLDSSASQSDSTTQFLWADAAWKSGEPTSAFEHWRTAGAFVYFMQQAYRAQNRNAWQDQENFARIAVGINAQSAEAHFLLGDALAHLNVKNLDAFQELERAAELTQHKELLATIFSRKGEVLSAEGKLREALEIFNQARAVAPLDARPRTDYALTIVQSEPNARAEAIALLTQVVNDSPWYTAAYIALAKFAEERGDVQTADQWLQSGLAKNPQDARLNFALGEFYARQRRYGEARIALTLALKGETRASVLIAIARALKGLPPE